MKKPQRDDIAEPSAPGALEPERGSFGSWLRRQREVRDITLREIADDSKISLRYLQALEEDRFDILPAPVFVKGFLRHYARYVGLDAEDVVNYYLVARQSNQPTEEKDEPRRRRTSHTGWRWGWLFVIVVGLLLGVVAVLSYLAEQKREALPESQPPAVVPQTEPEGGGAETTDAPAEPIATPSAEGEATPETPPSAPPAETPAEGEVAAIATTEETEAAPAAPLRVALQFDGECWVEVRVDGRRRLSETRVQGEALELEAQQEIRLTLGDAGAVRIEVNGRSYALESSPGQVVRDLKIDLALAEQLAAGPGPRS